MNITITKAENGWIIAKDNGPGYLSDKHVATDATLADVVRQVAGISPLADLPQTVEAVPKSAPDAAFQPGDTVECINNSGLSTLFIGKHYTVSEIHGDFVYLSDFSPNVGCNITRFRKVEPQPAPEPEPETDEEVPGEAEAWFEWRSGTAARGDFPYIGIDIKTRFRAALRVAIEADRKRRGVGGVITWEQLAKFVTTYLASSSYDEGDERLLNALATLGITVEGDAHD